MAETATLISLVVFIAELWVLVCCYAAGTAVGLSLGGLYLVVETLHLVPGTGALTAWLKAYLSGVSAAVCAAPLYATCCMPLSTTHSPAGHRCRVSTRHQQDPGHSSKRVMQRHVTSACQLIGAGSCFPGPTGFPQQLTHRRPPRGWSLPAYHQQWPCTEHGACSSFRGATHSY
jgi:hypothetical protein